MIDPGGSLGPDARALLEAARDGLAPEAAAVRRMRANIQLTAGGAAGTAIGIKLALLAVAVVAVVAVVGAGVALTRGPTLAVAPRVELATPLEPAVAARAPALPRSDEDLITIEPMAEPTTQPTTQPTTESTTEPARPTTALPRAVPEPTASTPRRARANVEPRSAPTARTTTAAPAAPATPVGLSREVELVDLAMAALRRGDPGAALRAVHQHAAETAGRGQLAEDAAAIEIEALCHLHDPRTHARLEAFDARFPRSAQRSRLSTRCP
jgi:outer membrane biosynthesis protein TonB